MSDPVTNPDHYTWIPGIECKDVAKYFNYHRGSAIKLIWRAGRKGDEVEDIEKAIMHLQFELERITNTGQQRVVDAGVCDGAPYCRCSVCNTVIMAKGGGAYECPVCIKLGTYIPTRPEPDEVGECECYPECDRSVSDCCPIHGLSKQDHSD